MTKVGIEFAERALPDGLTALAVRNPGVETTSIGAFLHVSQLEEPATAHGLAYLTGSCLEEGTASKSSVELAEAVEAIGGALSTDEAGARVRCPATEVDAACELLREVLLEPGFRPDDVARVQREVLVEIEADQEEPATVAAHRFRAEIYGEHPLGRPAWGSRESMASFDAAQVREFWQTWFRPARGYVVLAGPFELERQLDLLERTFAALRGPSPEPVQLTPPARPVATRAVHLPMDREQVHVFVGHPGIRRTDPDYESLLVMDNVLGAGAGFTARIPKLLRDERGLCYSVGASITSSAGEEPGTFRAYIGTSPEHRDEAVAGFLDEIRRIRATDVEPDELRVAQDYLAGSFVLGLERNTSLMNYAVRWKRFGLGFDYLSRFPELVRAVSIADVRRVAEAHLDPDHVVIVSAGA